MDSTNEKLVFQLENKKSGNVIFQYEVDLIGFQKEVLENENVSFFYTFKDMSVELEEKISLKLKLGESKDAISFIVKYSDKILSDLKLDVCGIEEKNISQNEVELYFIFEKVSQIIINKISEEHKGIILASVEKK